MELNSFIRKANDWRTRERVVLDLFSNLEKRRSERFFGEPLKHVITIRGQILVSRTDGDPPPLSPPLLPLSPLPRVSVQKFSVCRFKNVPVCSGTTPACGNTCACGAGTHGDVLNLHTEVFSACQAAPHTKQTTHTTQNTNTNTRRQTDREKVDRERERIVKCDNHCELQESCFF